jgi:hypothetical protein
MSVRFRTGHPRYRVEQDRHAQTPAGEGMAQDEDPDTIRRQFADAVDTVHGYVPRHLAQRPDKEDVATSRWRYSLMDWGHDPLKKS